MTGSMIGAPKTCTDMVRLPVSLPDPLVAAASTFLPEPLLQAAAAPTRATTAPAAATRRARRPGLPRPPGPDADPLPVALDLIIVSLRWRPRRCWPGRMDRYGVSIGGGIICSAGARGRWAS